MANEIAIHGKETMSHLEIAEITGKRIDNVARDLKNLEKQGVIDLLKFEVTEKDSQNRSRNVYYLPKRETLILTSGYSSHQRAKIIDRWMELEGMQMQPTVSADEQMKMDIDDHEERIGSLERNRTGINKRREATVMGKLSASTVEQRKAEAAKKHAEQQRDFFAEKAEEAKAKSNEILKRMDEQHEYVLRVAQEVENLPGLVSELLRQLQEAQDRIDELEDKTSSLKNNVRTLGSGRKQIG